MADPLSNATPSSGTNAYPGGVKATRKVGGSRVTHDGSRHNVGGPGEAGAGLSNPTPEDGRAKQDAANGTVHGQPLSHYNAGN